MRRSRLPSNLTQIGGRTKRAVWTQVAMLTTLNLFADNERFVRYEKFYSICCEAALSDEQLLHEVDMVRHLAADESPRT